jgi:DNA-directed RNA polymerase subunit RPC12/RpoP
MYVPPDDATVRPATPLDPPPARLRRPRNWRHGMLGCGYDCARCGARVRGLQAGRVSCQRCLAPVGCRVIDTAQERDASESEKPAAA